METAGEEQPKKRRWIFKGVHRLAFLIFLALGSLAVVWSVSGNGGESYTTRPHKIRTPAGNSEAYACLSRAEIFIDSTDLVPEIVLIRRARDELRSCLEAKRFPQWEIDIMVNGLSQRK